MLCENRIAAFFLKKITIPKNYPAIAKEKAVIENTLCRFIS